ncbi:hypothetical protein [Variovorax paradoxus]|uniref:hypothetical protein n=1 Tax=Variovorax paradoxus TaxID=34073 RepID=UPI00277DFECC|nr:hypothetical protein [Variovorax paradoxus]MDP9927826.1 hypothetical protein [Variovorax paradoxus]
MQFGRNLRALMSTLGYALLVALSACGGGGGGGGAVLPILPVTSAPAPPSTGRTVHDSISSTRTGATYTLDIYLPPSYDGSSAAFPVIYAMDGDANFNPPGGASTI